MNSLTNHTDSEARRKFTLYMIQTQSCYDHDFDDIAVYKDETEALKAVRDLIIENISDEISEQKSLSEADTLSYLENVDIIELRELWNEHHCEDWSFIEWTCELNA